MKRYTKNIITLSFLMSAFLIIGSAHAYWIWTPETKKFINPKNAVKDSPKEQFDWAIDFYDAKDYQRAAAEFDKLAKQYEYSEYASKAQYYVGLCYEAMGKYYTAFENYQKAIDNFPNISNIDEIIAREFNIAKMYAGKASPKILGTDIMTSTDRAIEVYKKVVDNAPYGKLADEAQYNMAEALKKSERYDEAIQAFQKILDDYPNSGFFEKSRFEVADCAYRASLKPAYDVAPTDKAIRAFEGLAGNSGDEKLVKQADATLKRLKDKVAEKAIITARFYESQKHYKSAVIYYREVLDKYPESSFAKEAGDKIEELNDRMAGRAPAAGKKNNAWAPITFDKKVEKKKTGEPKVESIEPKKAAWKPLKFDSKKAKAVKTKTVKQKSKDTWKPFSFDKKKAGEPKVESIEPKKAAWKPLKFDSKKAKAVKTETVKQKSKTPWKPLSFGKKKVESIEPKKSAWKPLKFSNRKDQIKEVRE